MEGETDEGGDRGDDEGGGRHAGDRDGGGIGDAAVAAFEAVVERFDGPMMVVTAHDGDRSAGCLVGFTTQCSIRPRRFLVCISTANATSDVARAADVLAVHPLRRSQHALARLFGEETGDEVDKLAWCGWRPGPHGVPVLDGCDWFAGPVRRRVGLGDHVGHLIDVQWADLAPGDERAPLGFQAVRDLRAGHGA